MTHWHKFPRRRSTNQPASYFSTTLSSKHRLTINCVYKYIYIYTKFERVFKARVSKKSHSYYPYILSIAITIIENVASIYSILPCSLSSRVPRNTRIFRNSNFLPPLAEEHVHASLGGGLKKGSNGWPNRARRSSTEPLTTNSPN